MGKERGARETERLDVGGGGSDRLASPTAIPTSGARSKDQRSGCPAAGQAGVLNGGWVKVRLLGPEGAPRICPGFFAVIQLRVEG